MNCWRQFVIVGSDKLIELKISTYLGLAKIPLLAPVSFPLGIPFGLGFTVQFNTV